MSIVRWPTRGPGANLCDQEVDYSFERVEAEGLPDRCSKIRVRIDVVENQAAVRALQILDTADVKFTGSHQSFPGING
jgi:hypothetical protein